MRKTIILWSSVFCQLAIVVQMVSCRTTPAAKSELEDIRDVRRVTLVRSGQGQRSEEIAYITCARGWVDTRTGTSELAVSWSDVEGRSQEDLQHIYCTRRVGGAGGGSGGGGVQPGPALAVCSNVSARVSELNVSYTPEFIDQWRRQQPSVREQQLCVGVVGTLTQLVDDSCRYERLTGRIGARALILVGTHHQGPTFDENVRTLMIPSVIVDVDVVGSMIGCVQSLQHLLTAGTAHSCAIDAASVKCWGSGDLGQTRVPSGLGLPQMIIGKANHSCVVTQDNRLSCWGYSSEGQLGYPRDLRNVTFAAAASGRTCAIQDRKLSCWGQHNHLVDANRPALTDPTVVAPGVNHTCVIDGGTVKCWARGTTPDERTAVPTLFAPTMLSSGTDHTCALDRNGVKCWGKNWYGQTNVPSGLRDPFVVTTGHDFSCAIDRNGVHCWGNNGQGQTNVPRLENPVAVAAGMEHACALDRTSIGIQVKCWGSNAYHQSAPPQMNWE